MKLFPFILLSRELFEAGYVMYLIISYYIERSIRQINI